MSSLFGAENPKTKRHRADGDGPNTVPSAVPSAASVASQTSGDRGTEVQLIGPYLDGIPEILVQISTNNEVEDVAAAVASLMDILDEDACPLNYRKNKKTASRLGAHSFVIMAMRKWQHNESVQKKGCGCLQLFAFGTEWSWVRLAMAELGAIEACLDAMKLFPECLSLVKYGVIAINNIFCTAEVAVKYGDRFLNQLDGVSAVVEAMKKYRDNPDFQRSSCILFKTMSGHKELQKDLLKSGAMSAVATAVEQHPENENIKDYGATFMKNVFGGGANA